MTFEPGNKLAFKYPYAAMLHKRHVLARRRVRSAYAATLIIGMILGCWMTLVFLHLLRSKP